MAQSQQAPVQLTRELDFKIPSDLPRMDVSHFINHSSERIWQGPFTFVLGADPQFGMIASCKLHKSTPSWEAEVQLTRETIARINAMTPKPKFFLVCGDMLDAYPFEKPFPYYNNNDITVRHLQYADFTKVLQELDPDVKLVCVCGNHDVGDVPTQDSLRLYRQQFGLDYFAFWVGGVKFVVLNSQFFFSPEALPEETTQHLAFIESCIADATAKFIVVFQHIPFFMANPEEEDLFKNIPKERRLVLLEKLWNAGVRYIFCGHCHRNAGGRYKDMEQVVTSAMGAPFGQDPSGFRVVHVDEGGITHEYIPLRETIDCTEFDEELKKEVIIT